MKRTAGTYSTGEQSLTPTEDLYHFANTARWPDWRVDQRMDQLQELQRTVPFGPERKAAVTREIQHLFFEQICRLDLPILGAEVNG